MDLTLNIKEAIMDNSRTLLSTTTGEYFHPVRLYYKIFNKNEFIKCLSKLNCMDFDKKNQRVVWLYHGKAKSLAFKKKYSKIAKKFDHPIVIGSFFLRDDHEAYLELRSFDRACKAIPFFAKYIPRTVSEVSEIAVMNTIFDLESGEEHAHRINFDYIFESKNYIVAKQENQFDSLDDLDYFEQDIKSLERPESIEKLQQTEIPEIERFPVKYYEEGIKLLELALKIRETISMTFWKENEE